MTLTAFVVDDEPLAVQRLVRLLRKTDRIEVVGSATDPSEAIRVLAERPVDVLFLDIHMPEIDGFALVERLDRVPLVVFTTAHDEHALRAFEVLAIDYLLKPIEQAQLDRALDKLERVAGASGAPPFAELLEMVRSPRAPQRIASRLGDRVTLLDLDAVSHFQASDRLTYAVSDGKDHVVDETLAALERRLDPALFVRIHRNTLVNIRFITELRGDGAGLVVVLKDDAQLPVARDRVRPLKERLGI
ncbi:MAG TPA: LytTR family DNA-binding domain-containing protein [Kofleriaceae bacterium]